MIKLRFFLTFISLAAIVLLAFSDGNEPTLALSYPSRWPKPVHDFSKHPLEPARVQLGRTLFYDPILSKDNTVSCANCHLSYTAFTHVDHALSHGIHDSIGTRNSMALVNLAWSKSFMWDGAFERLDAQAMAPITHPAEMGETLEGVLKKLNDSPVYRALFEQAYNQKEVGTQQLLDALAQFQLTLVSAGSKYDKAQAGEYEFNEQEAKGYRIFKIHCNNCHTEPLFTNGGFENNGLAVDESLNDLGRYLVTQRPQDSLKFKVPSLRNVEFSKPYMHDGRFKTLREVVEHYNSGIHSSATLSNKMKPELSLTDHQKADLIAFMLTLSDRDFLFNPDFAFPRK